MFGGAATHGCVNAYNAPRTTAKLVSNRGCTNYQTSSCI
jgi:hypothetical protein